MGIRGQRPKPPGHARTRNPQVHGWTEIENVPNESGPRLPARRRNGQPWPESARLKWSAWRRMPHTVLWQPSDWQFAFDSIELAAQLADGAPAAVATELRAREKVLGTTHDARLSQRIRYVTPRCTDMPEGTSVAQLDDYRDL